MNGGYAVVYLARRAVLLAGVAVLAAAPTPLRAQTAVPEGTDGPPARWTLQIDGDATAWPDTVATAPVDSLQHVGRRILRHYRRDGYYHARIDSAVIDTTADRPRVRIHLRRGPRVVVGRLRITGASAVSTEELRRSLTTETGAPLDPRRLRADIQAILDRYEEEGRPLAAVRIRKTRVDTASAPRLALTLAIDEGPELWLREVEVSSGARTSPGLVARLADLDVGAPLVGYDPDEIRAALRDRPYFESVGTPELEVGPDGGATLHVPVEEAAPGAFDLVVGYLPPSGTRGGQLVGSGHLVLEHLFGGGREVDLALDRRPGRTSVFDLSVSDPYIFGLPFRLTGAFQGEQRDSTFAERAFRLEAGYHFSRSVELSGRISREIVRPGAAGTQLRSTRQRVPRAQTLFYGVGVHYETIDRPDNPRRGLMVDVHADQGRKERALRRITGDGDTTRTRTTVRQERLRGALRAYVPLFDRQVLVLGGDGNVLRSRSYDRSDLFRFGGATSLRGYDEDQFLGNVTLRGLLEYRVQLDRRSYVYAFGDLGYLERPALGRTSASRAWRPGYGVGLQVDTAVGLVTTTYALNPELTTPADGRLHFGLSVGL
jgi:outer membrane protein assembly factor BamA